MVHQRRRFGNWGEDAAVRYLETRGYEILDRNYRSSWGEIDIIARQRDVLAFVEKGGSGCKLCGYWKVYGDVEAARARFVCYDACRTCVLRAVEQGITLAQLLQAA